MPTDRAAAEPLRRFEVVYADPLSPSGENCYWRTATTAAAAMATVPRATRAYEVPSLFGSGTGTTTP